jgi:hypothetical protein
MEKDLEEPSAEHEATCAGRKQEMASFRCEMDLNTEITETVMSG